MKDSINSFRQAVEETTEVKDGYRVGVHIPAVSSHYKMLATKGLLPKRKLVL